MLDQSLSQISSALRNGTISSTELTRMALDKATENTHLNAFITLTEDQALADAAKADTALAAGNSDPLCGVVTAHKDIFCSKGVLTSCGSKILSNFISPYNATVIEKTAARNMISIGKTNMDEFAMGSTTESSFYGPTLNPWNTEHVPGGSSGGAAVVVSAGIVPISTGTDTGGSVRQPAALCGLSGIKPTYGRVSRWGMVAFASSFDQAGVFSRSAEDAALMLTEDAARARAIAGALDAANRERRDIERATVDAAIEQVESQNLSTHPALVVQDPAWHPGVVGLVASRLTSRYSRPAVVIGEGGKGSARSIEGVNLYEALCASAEPLERFGGHKAAAGVTLLPENVPIFREAMDAAVVGQIGEPPYIATVRPDLEVDVGQLSYEMLSGLELLAPFGQKNPEPLLVARRVPVHGKRAVAKDHLKLRLGTPSIDAIAFGRAELIPKIPNFVDVAFNLQRNTYGGVTSLQMRVDDLRVPSEE